MSNFLDIKNVVVIRQNETQKIPSQHLEFNFCF